MNEAVEEYLTRCGAGRPPLSELADPGVDQSRVDIRQLVVPDAPVVELARRIVLGIPRPEQATSEGPWRNRLGPQPKDDRWRPTAALLANCQPDL